MQGYEVKIVDASKNLSAKEKIAMKDTTNAFSLDEVIDQTPDGKLIIDVDFYVVLDVHNEKSDNVDYSKFVLVDKDGKKYVTGSEPFFTSFKGIWDEMQLDESGEKWELICYKMESNNYKGKQFLTCSIM